MVMGWLLLTLLMARAGALKCFNCRFSDSDGIFNIEDQDTFYEVCPESKCDDGHCINGKTRGTEAGEAGETERFQVCSSIVDYDDDSDVCSFAGLSETCIITHCDAVQELCQQTSPPRNLTCYDGNKEKDSVNDALEEVANCALCVKGTDDRGSAHRCLTEMDDTITTAERCKLLQLKESCGILYCDANLCNGGSSGGIAKKLSLLLPGIAVILIAMKP